MMNKTQGDYGKMLAFTLKVKIIASSTVTC